MRGVSIGEEWWPWSMAAGVGQWAQGMKDGRWYHLSGLKYDVNLTH